MDEYTRQKQDFRSPEDQDQRSVPTTGTNLRTKIHELLVDRELMIALLKSKVPSWESHLEKMRAMAKKAYPGLKSEFGSESPPEAPEPGNPPMPGTESVENIAAMITEDIRPGTMGIVEKKDQRQEKGDHNQVKFLARYITQYAKRFHEMADMGDLEQARLAMAQVQGAVEQAKEHIELLAKEKGLPNLSV